MAEQRMRLSNKLSAAAGALSAVIIAALASDAVLTVIAAAAGPGQVAWETLATGGSMLWPIVYAAAEATTLIVYTYAAYLTYRLFTRGGPEDAEAVAQKGSAGPLSAGRLRGATLLAVTATAASMLASYYQPLVCGVMGVPEQVFRTIYASISSVHVIAAAAVMVSGSLGDAAQLLRRRAVRPAGGAVLALAVTFLAHLSVPFLWEDAVRWLWPWLITEAETVAAMLSEITPPVTAGIAAGAGYIAGIVACAQDTGQHHS